MRKWTLLGLATLAVFLLSEGTMEAKNKVTVPEGFEVATFAGGCFWCMEPPFDKVDGVVSTISGYIGGEKKNPTYKEVCSGTTGHTEAVQVVYDPKKVSYEELLKVYWRNIDPTTPNRQFCDYGSQYRPEIFYHNDEQKQLATKSKQSLIDSRRFDFVVPDITAASTFYVAEEYHQDFYLKEPEHYKKYRQGCGRDQRLKDLWGESS